MRNNPFNQFRFFDRAVRKTPAERFKFVVRTSKRKSVYLQKNHHGKYADAFVPVKKGMVFNEGKSKMRRHCLNGRVQILSAECMIRRIDREIKQISVPYAVKTAALGDKPAMQRYYFISVNTFYMDQFANLYIVRLYSRTLKPNMKHKFHANALNAAMCLSSISPPAVITSSGEASANSTASISVIGVKVILVRPAGTSRGTLRISLWLTGISTVCVTLIKKI